ncbi:SAPS-domain-containing protein [Coemansia reversa NRRL 1564]|uniref:SAPS-domain-containing protein n=1 Tax=Coemansia reversa (strain ATCC 12441 / NRRL 1564) TaxID=763665 RepID=A0A2G5B525_COERN|nr:SAPS-domain-containing protein [Coemansia reversa NRRL 1564]|eukprot:PIA14100.1 SAPS-domain-containing protein [Coemansia reversa NRRL 1564]
MLWRFGLQHASNIDKLLEKEDLTLEEVLNDPDLLQEIREQNPKVISYLSMPQNLRQMVEYTATEEFFKFSKMAATSCEVLCSNSAAFGDGLVAAYVPRDFVESDFEGSDYEDDGSHAEIEGRHAGPVDNPRSSSSSSNNNNVTASSNPQSPASPRQHLLELLWGIMGLEHGQLDLLQATHFSRVMCSLLQRKPYETLAFIREQDGAVEQFLEHLDVTAIVDLLLKVISLEELENAPSIIAWLSDRRLVEMLVERMAPDRDPDMHSLAAQVLLDIIAISQCNNPLQPTIGTNALIEELKSEQMVQRLTDYMLDRTAPHGTSTLTNCVYIFIELIRRNYSDMVSELSPDADERDAYGFDGESYGEVSYTEEAGNTQEQGQRQDLEQDLEHQQDPMQQQDQSDSPHSGRQLPTVDLSDMLRVLALHTGDLVELLNKPRSSTEPVATTQGMREPLGFERLRICELFAELLHCSNMPRLNQRVGGQCDSNSSGSSSPRGETPQRDIAGAVPGATAEPGETAFRDSPTVESGFAALGATEAAGEHTAENTAVGQLLKWQFIEHEVVPVMVDLFFRFPLNNFLHSVVYDIMHQVLNLPLQLESNVALIVVAFRDVHITSRVAQASARNEAARREPQAEQLGYMGHLTGIGEEVARLLELSGAALEPLISPYIDGDEWLDYVARALQEVRERDQQPLGGERPGTTFGGAGDDGDVDMAADSAAQVFVSHMGLVDPAASDAYGAEVDDEDDVDEDDELGGHDDDDEASRYTRRMYGYRDKSGSGSAGMLYPNEEDDGEDTVDYIASHSNLYFNRTSSSSSESTAFGLPPSTAEDEDQFVIRDDVDDVGPADRIGRYNSYQNANMSVVSSDDEDEDDDNNADRCRRIGADVSTRGGTRRDSDDDDSDDASGTGAADSSHGQPAAAGVLDAAPQEPSQPSQQRHEAGGEPQGKRRSAPVDPMCSLGAAGTMASRHALLVPSGDEEWASEDLDEEEREGGLRDMGTWEKEVRKTKVDEDLEEDAEDERVRRGRRLLIRLSLDGSAHTAPAADDSAALPGYLLSLSNLPSPSDAAKSEPVHAVDAPPPMPPRPTDAEVELAANGVAPAPSMRKGRVHDLLFREAKQRSLSSSELDNIVPADIASWGPDASADARARDELALPDAPLPAASADDAAVGGRPRAASFAARRRRSRSQSAGVGISRAMVIQAAVQGQFPYLDAKTCEFVGQLKSDSVTLGGAAAGPTREPARPRAATPVPPLPLKASPAIKPISREPPPDDNASLLPQPLRATGLPPSGLRMRSSAVASDSDDDDGTNGDKSPQESFPPIPSLPLSFSVSSAVLPTPPVSSAKPVRNGNSSSKFTLNEGTAALSYAATNNGLPSSRKDHASALSAPVAAAVSDSTMLPPLPLASIVKPAPSLSTAKPPTLSWAAVVSTPPNSSAAAETAHAGQLSGTNALGARRGRNHQWPRTQRHASNGSVVVSAVPEFPVLPMSPVHKSAPKLFAAKK